MKLQKKIKKKAAKKEPYFGKAAHKAIVDYQRSDSTEEKHAIYEKTIKRSFEKLAENLIYIYGFSRDPEHFKVLKLDCVSFLYETLEKFDSERGSKAFSYFNVCAKNHLLMKSKKTTKNKIRNVSLEDLAELNSAEKDMVEKYKMIPAQDALMIREEDKEWGPLHDGIPWIFNSLSRDRRISITHAPSRSRGMMSSTILIRNAIFVFAHADTAIRKEKQKHWIVYILGYK